MHHILDNVVVAVEDSCCQEDHIVHVDKLVELLLVQEAVEDNLEMVVDNSLMLEAGRKEGTQDLERIRMVDLAEVVRNHVEVDRNSLEVVARNRKRISFN